MLHLDEAWPRAKAALASMLTSSCDARVLLVRDAFGRFRVLLWDGDRTSWEATRDEINQRLAEACEIYWSGAVLRGRCGEHPDSSWQKMAWQRGTKVGSDPSLRLLERHQSKAVWSEAPRHPPWPSTSEQDPDIALFYSFNGGVGRSTALAAVALHLARRGDRVAVIDADLDAPGVGALLSAGNLVAPWGIADYLLESPLFEEGGEGGNVLDLADYHHRYVASGLDGDVVVFPAGTTGPEYLEKLARLDYGSPPTGAGHPFVGLLKQIRSELAPAWILIDVTAGLGELSGFLMGGLCHHHVLFGNLSAASWSGMRTILDRLGRIRLAEGRAQAECVLAAAMLPSTDRRLYQELVVRFTDRSRDAFSEHYYAEAGSGESGSFWSLDDVEGQDAPHVPVALPHDARLAVFRDLDEVAEPVLLDGIPYRQLTEKLLLRAGRGRGKAVRQRLIREDCEGLE